MANSKLIIVEGPQGAGKTTITDYIRNRLPYTNLYRLSGTSDSSKNGKAKAAEMYDDLLSYIKKLENKSINLLFDRTFFTEEIYCRMKKKEYDFSDVYFTLEQELFNMDYDIYYITLYLNNTSNYEFRLLRPGKAIFEVSKFSIQNSIAQQQEYLELANSINLRYKEPNIHIYNIATDIEKEEMFKILDTILNIEKY